MAINESVENIDLVEYKTPKRDFLFSKKLTNFYEIETTTLEPTKAILYHKNFRNLYTEQLKQVCFGFEEGDSIIRLVPILVCFEAFIEEKPLQIRFNVRPEVRKEIVKVLNYFIRKEFDILKGFYRIFKSEILKNYGPLVNAKEVKEESLVTIEPITGTIFESDQAEDIFQ